jgi:hypothetical protein
LLFYLQEIESWISFVDSLSSSEDGESFEKMLNDCYKYAAAINAKGKPFPAEPLIMALLLSQHKIIDWLTKQISKHELHSNKEVKEYKQQEAIVEKGTLVDAKGYFLLPP